MPPRPDDSDSVDSAARAEQTPAQQPSESPVYDDWEVVPLYGMALGDAAEAATSPRSPATREVELQTRIRDLNQCNEVLLSRVHQLEEALERSQQALQQEVERSQRATAEEKAAAAQSQSVAQLLSELEQSNEALGRQTILAETLSAQLETFQGRNQHLENECALLRRRNAEKAQQLQAAEESCTDLRSRLQRQQRYTLQFKAALEKCLDTPAFKRAAKDIEAEPSVEPLHPAAAHSGLNLVMPRAEQIQPWSASGTATPTDPQLLSLMRSQPSSVTLEDAAAATVDDSFSSTQPVTEAAAAEVTPPSETTPNKVSSEAENQLWQDVERVIENADTTSEMNFAASADAAKAPSQPSTQESESAQFTEPIPWGAPIQKEIPHLAEEAEETILAKSNEKQPQSVTETARSPKSWPPSEALSTVHADSRSKAYAPSSFATSVPALDAMTAPQSSPSPVVHPLRPAQRKRKSLAAVELPSFPPLPKVE